MLKHRIVVLVVAFGCLLMAGSSNGQEKGVKAIEHLLTRFTYKAEAGPVTVYSDISAQFSGEHAKNGEKVWLYFSKVFAKTPGTKTVWYYTRDTKLMAEIAKHTPWPNAMPGARMVTALWNTDHRVWFCVPYQEPDFGTQMHEMSHDFLYATYPANAEHPWLAEGTGMYWETGRWDTNGDLVVDKAHAWYLGQFQEAARKKQLIPLAQLLTQKRDTFFAPPVTKVYAQSMVLVHYLMKEHSAVMKDLFNRLNTGDIKDNDRLVKFLLSSLKMDITTLEKKYIAFGLSLKP